MTPDEIQKWTDDVMRKARESPADRLRTENARLREALAWAVGLLEIGAFGRYAQCDIERRLDEAHTLLAATEEQP